MVRGENQASWYLFSPLDSVQEIMQRWPALATQLENRGINLPTFVELGPELFQCVLEVGTGVPENGFLVLLKASLGYGDKQSEYFHIVLAFCGKLGNLFPSLFFKKKKVN